MPNHTMNTVVVEGDKDRIEFFMAITGLDGKRQDSEGNHVLTFDFNTFVPRPEILERTISGSGYTMECGEAYVAYHDEGDMKPLSDLILEEKSFDGVITGMPIAAALRLIEKNYQDGIEYARTKRQAFRETGHEDWYSWSCANWGTKWNSYDVYVDSYNHGEKLIFGFLTAWSAPFPVMDACAKMFPDLHITMYSEYEGGEGESMWEHKPKNMKKRTAKKQKPIIVENNWSKE